MSESTALPQTAPAESAVESARTTARKSLRLPLRRTLLRIGSIITALVAWQALTTAHVVFWLHFDRLPAPTDVVADFVAQLGTGTYYQDLVQSLVRILSGFLLATVTGTAIGVAVARSPTTSDILRPALEIVRPIPAIALVPIAILLFPTNEQGIVFITFLAAFFPIVVNTRHAVRSLPTVWEEAVRTMGATRIQILRTVVVPGILPGVFSGLSVAIGVGWICVISAEMISGQLGVGYRTWQAYTVVDYPGVLVGMISIGVLGWVTSAVVERIGRRVTRWLPRAEVNQ
jgi:NitT/TauT family transport system permease protein